MREGQYVTLWLPVAWGTGMRGTGPELWVVKGALGIGGVDRRRPASRAALDDREDGGKHDQGRQGRRGEAADDSPPQRRGLLAPFAPAKGHGEHTGCHGTARHQDRPEAALSP